ncbi:sugar kinase [Arthrobacter sp. JZ12]|uniref:PfkB family carbohydrate kinase n=1 Tax=Arthrobacter sp. JZ12 TaxID=2654190 RepID=UPI002B48402A|nr:PfkB family carbohydrate kinase [Arthrobacter sp. JZ12]WRH26063.1 sugar kinase [Arthrobacter sp. JZ12]
MKALGFGDNIIDRYLDRGMVYPGGNCVNFAVFARKLGVDAAYLGVFGSDEHARFLRDSIRAEGVDLSCSVTKDGSSGISTIRIVDGERVFGGWNGGGVTVSDPLELDEALLGYVAGFDLVHSSVYSRSERELPKVRRSGPLVSFDFSSEEEFRTADYLAAVCPSVDLALISCSDLAAYDAEHLLSELVRQGAGLALGTCGDSGAIVFDGESYLHAPASPLEPSQSPIDTMGCGDAFLTAFAVTLFGLGWSRTAPPQEASLREALRAGADFAAQQCLVEGAFGHGAADSGLSVSM